VPPPPARPLKRNIRDGGNDSENDGPSTKKAKKTMTPRERLQKGLEEATKLIPRQIVLDPRDYEPTYSQYGECTNVAEIHSAIENLQRSMGAGKAIHILAHRNVGYILRNHVRSKGQIWTNGSKIDAQRWYEEQSGKTKGALQTFFFAVEQVYQFCISLNDEQILRIRTTSVDDIRRQNKAGLQDIRDRVTASQAIGDEGMDAIQSSKRISKPSLKLREA
jgi:hypothetical protein